MDTGSAEEGKKQALSPDVWARQTQQSDSQLTKFESKNLNVS